jgi:hypothetical protein
MEFARRGFFHLTLGIPSQEKFRNRKTTYKDRDGTDQPAPHNEFHFQTSRWWMDKARHASVPRLWNQKTTERYPTDSDENRKSNMRWVQFLSRGRHKARGWRPCAPGPLHGTRADAGGIRHRRSSPLGRLDGRSVRVSATTRSICGAAGQHSELQEPFWPPPHTQLSDFGLADDLIRPRPFALNETISARQTCLSGLAIPRERGQTVARFDSPRKFQLHGIDATEKVAVAKQLRRGKVIFFKIWRRALLSLRRVRGRSIFWESEGHDMRPAG